MFLVHGLVFSLTMFSLVSVALPSGSSTSPVFLSSAALHHQSPPSVFSFQVPPCTLPDPSITLDGRWCVVWWSWTQMQIVKETYLNPNKQTIQTKSHGWAGIPKNLTMTKKNLAKQNLIVDCEKPKNKPDIDMSDNGMDDGEDLVMKHENLEGFSFNSKNWKILTPRG